MIGTSAVLQGEYSEHYPITQPRLFLEQEEEEVSGITELELSVIDSQTGKPIPKAMISIDTLGCTATCDAQGNVILPNILSGKFVLDVIVPGYIANSTLVRVSHVQPERLTIKMVRNS